MLEKLKILNLSHSPYLTGTPDFSRLPHLEKLILKDCASLRKVEESIGDLHNLVLVDLEDCKSLKSLPRSFYKLKSLETLILSGCSTFDNLADNLGEIECLTSFLADNTAIRQIPFSIMQLNNLRQLSLCGCKGSPSTPLGSLFWSWMSPRRSPKSGNLLPASIQGFNSLKELCLRDCNLSDDGIPANLGSLCSLEVLDLRNNNFRSLPSSVGGLSKLETLYLDGCRELQSITDLPASLITLCAKNCTALERMPNLSNISNLVLSFLNNCHKLVGIPCLIKSFLSFPQIDMEGCKNITSPSKQSLMQVSSLALPKQIFVFYSFEVLFISNQHASDGTGMVFGWMH